MTAPLNPEQVLAQVRALIANCPELQDDEEFRLDMLEGATSFNEMLSRLIVEIEDNDSFSEALKGQINARLARKERYARKRNVLTELCFKLMKAAQARKVNLPEATVSIRALPPSVVIDDEEDLFDMAFKISREVSRSQIKALLEANIPVPGARMSNDGETLSIRRK